MNKQLIGYSIVAASYLPPPQGPLVHVCIIPNSFPPDPYHDTLPIRLDLLVSDKGKKGEDEKSLVDSYDELYLSSNESSLDETISQLSAIKFSNPNSVYIGVSGYWNYKLMFTINTNISLAILIDRNQAVLKCHQYVIDAMKDSSTYNQFEQSLRYKLAAISQTFCDIDFRSKFVQEALYQFEFLNNPINYNKLKQLCVDDKIRLCYENLGMPTFSNHLNIILKANHRSIEDIGFFYISNVADWLLNDSDAFFVLRDFILTIHELNRDVVILDAESGLQSKSNPDKINPHFPIVEKLKTSYVDILTKRRYRGLKFVQDKAGRQSSSA